MGPIDYPESSVNDRQSTLHKIPEERKSQHFPNTQMKLRLELKVNVGTPIFAAAV
jgi:hypothetical protein